MSFKELTEDEIFRLRQLICEHIETTDKDSFSCTCCGEKDQECIKCHKEIEHECYNHEEDGYCVSCR